MAVSNMRQVSNAELAEVLTEFEEAAIQYAALNINMQLSAFRAG